MEYKNEEWTIDQFLNLYKSKKIDLSPPYQRKEIWTLKDQKLLINSIKNNFPMPNFFLSEKGNGTYEMVDGQQRSRSIIGYWMGGFPDNEKEVFTEEFKKDPANNTKVKHFNDYRISITVITKLYKTEFIEDFYTLVNKSGYGLSRPEVKKAEYFETKFLHLIMKLAENDLLTELNIFSSTTLKRMNDIDFVSELVAAIEHGITEKKDKVDYMYENDITQEKSNEIEEKFLAIIKIISRFNSIIPIRTTRYRQKNDFYSLFVFISNNITIDSDTLDYFYKVLVRIGPCIKPSQESCEPLKNYAINCVTQSNSKKARLFRNAFFEEVLLNQNGKPNATQEALMDFFAMDRSNYVRLSGYTLIDLNQMEIPEEYCN